jgi:hypothetical protein
MATEVPLTYQQSPRPVGFPLTLKLTRDRLVIDSQRKVDEMRLDAIESVRLTYETGSLGTGHFKTKLRLKDGRTAAFTSITWSSMVQSRSLAPEYRAFVTALVAAIARANPGVRLVAGKPRFAWTAMAIISAATFVVVVLFVGGALAAGATAAALVAAAIGAVGLWQLAPMVRRNRPRAFAPDAVPSDLLG